MVRQIMLSVLTAPSDSDLAPEARPFAHGLARHCALLIAADETGSAHGLEPLPPPAQRRPAEVGAAGSTPNLKELDARLFIDTLTDGLGLGPERQQVRGVNTVFRVGCVPQSECCSICLR